MDKLQHEVGRLTPSTVTYSPSHALTTTGGWVNTPGVTWTSAGVASNTYNAATVMSTGSAG